MPFDYVLFVDIMLAGHFGADCCQADVQLSTGSGASVPVQCRAALSVSWLLVDGEWDDAGAVECREGPSRLVPLGEVA